MQATLCEEWEEYKKRMPMNVWGHASSRQKLQLLFEWYPAQ
jgi:hypothetical protein